MARMKVTWKEGDWIGIPLRKRGGFGLGLVARFRGGCIFGYYFGPRRSSVPTMEHTRGLKPQDALILALAGDLGLIRQEWMVIGKQQNFDREDWPMPWFRGVDGPQDVLRQHHEDDPIRSVAYRYVTKDEALRYPHEGLHGYLSMSSALDLAIAEKEQQTGSIFAGN